MAQKFERNHVGIILSLFDTGLGVVRSLARHKIPVIGCDYDSRMPGFNSRYCQAKLCPNPIHEPEKMLEFLLLESKKHTKPCILFPAADIFVIFLSRFRNELQHFFRFTLPSDKVLESIVNKKKQYELAETTKIPYPKTFYPKNFDDVHKIRKNLCYPIIIKPIYSYKWQERFWGIKGFKVNNAKELEKRYNAVQSADIEVMIQEIIPGPNTNHYKINVYINNNGEVLALFTLRKIRQYPIEFGVGSCVESIYSHELMEVGLKFFKGINYQGIGSIEFKRDERDGILKLIELNPRYWQQNYQATVSGINFPFIQYLDLTGKKVSPQTEFKTGIKWIDPIADFQAFWDNYRWHKLTFWGWLHSLKGNKVFANLHQDDLYPFLKNIEYGLKLIKIPSYLLKQVKS